MSNVYNITMFGLVFIFLSTITFYILSLILGIIFKGRNRIKEEERVKVIEKNKTKDLVDDEVLVAVITAAISSYTGASVNSFRIKSVKEASTPAWGMVERFRRMGIR